ncbi:MAG TPA: 50S ribosomal protein L10 [Nanoarchaeota archaeon]|nr:50S ribosomal protein L10 [Candidatus Woesearchaeota archaeon]HIH15008.1 50S ribosomal protein L10 [Nanoarchaeota archaeon]HIH58736.1 50S ribosomal protein L10 [Nanoarchaeota archaeon]HII13650.1 50S ribosomal protein L10 [Nanoarchaeota archaeon]HIJ05352.1 50S ribosomal protein L10 [Nanoarchaeota archaeon]
MNKPKAYVSDAKKQVVKSLAKQIAEYPIIGLVDMENLPAMQLQKMKQSLRGKVVIVMTKKRLIQYALKQSPKGLGDLATKIRGMPALIFTKENPFKLYKTLSASKSPAPAKQGQIAPRDVIVPAGKTNFAPGPIIGELGQLGIKAGIEDGKVAIKQDKLLVKEGEVFTQKVAETLTRLNILPMEVGLNVVAVFENGTIFDRKVLEIDEKIYLANLIQSHTEAMNLAIKIGYASKDTITVLLSKAQREAIALADSKDILTSENVNKLLAKAEAQANAIKNKAHIE